MSASQPLLDVTAVQKTEDAEIGGAAVFVERSEVLHSDPNVHTTPLEPLDEDSKHARDSGGQTSGKEFEEVADSAVNEAQGRERVASEVWDVGHVTVKAQELGLNVVEIASSASNEAAAVVQGLSDTMTGFSTSFVSLFSVFDTATPPPASDARKGKEKESSQSSSVRSASRDIDLQAIFGLPTEETLLESFPCSLLQSYKCIHNQFTPEIKKAFKGILYITDKHVCFFVDDFDRRIPIKLGVTDLKGVSRPKARRGEREDQLKLLLDSDNWLLFQEFASVQDFESALALLEHLAT